MSRSSEPLLKLLRSLLRKRNLNTAALAEAAGLPRARVRKVLDGTEPMTVDELLAMGTVLELSPSDFGLLEPGPGAAPEDDPQAPPSIGLADVDAEAEVRIDPWGNQPEQLFRTGFALGCDFLFVARTADLAGHGIPEAVLAQYAGRSLPIKLDAAYHRYNAPKFSPAGVTLTLSFDALYDCHFPWSEIEQVIFFPVAPEPPDDDTGEAEKAGPFLRLVK